MEFTAVSRKQPVEFPGVFVFGLRFSKGYNTIFWNIQWFSFALSGICRGKVKKEKFQGSFQKSISSTLLFGFLAHEL